MSDVCCIICGAPDMSADMPWCSACDEACVAEFDECIEVVGRQESSGDGLDMYFSPDLGALNGYYDGEVIQMSDHPRLRAASHPALSAAGRTAAHELGHALGLHHRQDSDDNLMRSKTLGWRLNREEINAARVAAQGLSSEPPSPL